MAVYMHPGYDDDCLMPKFLSFVAAITLTVSVAHPADAQEGYPNQPIRILYGFAAGGDVAARLIAEKLSDRLGKPIIFENVSGAAGNIAADQVARAEPNGYTVGMLTNANIVLRPLLFRNLSYDVSKAPVPVGQMWRFANVLIVRTGKQLNGLREVVEHARRLPGTLTFGHFGIGSLTHLSGELLKLRANIDVRGVPYRSTPALISDVISGRIDMAFMPPSAALPLAYNSKIRALATTSRHRAPSALNLPTIAESGYPNFEVHAWFGLFVPAHTPQNIVDRLSVSLQAIIAAPDVRNALLQLGLEPAGNTQLEFQNTIAQEKLLWKRILDEARIAPIE